MPNSKKIKVFEDQIEMIRATCIRVKEREILGTVKLTYVCRLFMVLDHMV